MRTAFIDELVVQARCNPRIFLVVGDLGYSVVESFASEFPNRYLNAGIAEQNMTGIAAGLASEGYHVFTYSIANFPTLRCIEQIRNDICYHKLPVTIVAVGAGLAYGNLGYSHHAVQDIGIMRTMPGLNIFSPSDPGEACQAVRWLSENPRPSYLRLGKAG
jgi:transketolase